MSPSRPQPRADVRGTPQEPLVLRGVAAREDP